MKKYFLFLFFALLSLSVFAQTDPLIFVNGDYAVGEMKVMNKGVLTFKTAYSNIDLKIEWDNRPVDGAAELDYVFHTGFGWSW